MLEFVTGAILNVASTLQEIVMPNDLLDKPKTAYVEMIEQQYRAEQELADRYRSFVIEILRLSLAGLAVFSFIYKQGSSLSELGDLAAKDVCALSGVAMFTLSAVFALLFLYFASEGLRWYIAGLRYYCSQPSGAQAAEGQAASGKEGSDNDYLAERKKWIARCRWSKGLAALTLALGGICMGSAIFALKLSSV